MNRTRSTIVALTALLGVPVLLAGQGRPAPRPDRAIRRDLPLTNTIRRAHAAGTRDSTGRPGAKYWQLALDYRIAARFDAATSTITGRETATITNNSDSVIRAVQLRLDQNIYAPNVPRAEVVPEITEGMKVTRLAINGTALDVNSRQLAPQLGLTSARIPLTAPIAAKGTATLEIEWSFRVPRADGGRGLRMGRWGDSLYQVAQWYPRVAVYDDLRGWDTDPYLGPSEFYNNFGRFDVTLDMPAGWVVGATGVLQNPEQVLTPAVRERLSHALESDSQRTILASTERGPGVATLAGDRLSWHFTADSVADFAWGTSNQYAWDATRANIPGKGFIPIQLMYLEGHRSPYLQAGSRVRHALEYYSKLWMPYAFPTMTVIDGPDGGMEYPSLIMSGLGAADHETGHQWWPMMVGVNETWYGWMDEGFNQYMNVFSDADRQGRFGNIDNVGQSYGRSSGSEFEGPLMWDANYGGPNYGFQAYLKAPMMLSMLGGIVGDSAVHRAMSDYAKTWRFKHPSPWDYAFFMDRALKQDLDWFWYYWLFTTESVDGSIAKVSTAAGRTTVTVHQDGQMPSPVVLKIQFAAKGAPIRKIANGVMADSVTMLVTWPVDVWFGGSKNFTATLNLGTRAIEKITLDPRGRFPDRDVSDNVWPRVVK
ncbi:MAG: M1 family metallopeptidase [Gemmatimonadales bacterium]